MNILGLDLSLSCTGYCIGTGKKILYGEIKTKASKSSDSQRILKITKAIDKLVKEYNIKHIAGEDIYHGPNIRTFKQLARLSGALMQLYGDSKYNLRFYMASSARKIVGINGRSPKCAVQLWVCGKYKMLPKKVYDECKIKIDEALLNRKTNKKHSDKIFLEVSKEIKTVSGLSHDAADAVLLEAAYRLTLHESSDKYTHKVLKKVSRGKKRLS